MGEERKSLESEIVSVKKEIASLRKKLNEINKEKEKWFEEKERIKKGIFEKVKEVKGMGVGAGAVDLRKERTVRDSYNAKVREISLKLRAFNDKLKEFKAKHDLKRGFDVVKEIEKLEESVEIQVLSLNKEKKVMEKIRRLRKVGAELKKLEGSGYKSLVGELESCKEKANEAHEKIKFALGRKILYKDFIAKSRDINDMKRMERDANRSFLRLRREFSKFNKKLKGGLEKVAKIQNEISKIKKDSKFKVDKKLLEVKSKSVEEKLKKREKLTTEDLIAFQGGANGDS